MFKVFILSSLLICPLAGQGIKVMELSDCLEYSLQNSPKLKKMHLHYENAIQNTLIAKAVYDLRVSFKTDHHEETSYKNKRVDKVRRHTLKLEKQIAGGTVLSTSGTYSNDRVYDNEATQFSIKLTQRILGGSYEKDMQKIKDEAINELISLNTLGHHKRIHKLAVTERFNLILGFKEQLAFQENRLLSLKEILKGLNNKPLDLSTVNIVFVKTEAKVQNLKTVIKLEKLKLKELMGMDLEKSIDLKGDITPEEFKRDKNKDTLDSFTKCEPIINNKLKETKIIRALKIANAEMAPDLYLSISNNYFSKIDEPRSLSNKNDVTVGLDLNFKIGRRKEIANLAKVKNLVQENLIDRSILRQNKKIKVISLDETLKNIEKLIKIQRQKIQYENQQVDLLVKNWQNNGTGIIRLVRAKNMLADSQNQLISLQVKHINSVAKYKFEICLIEPENL